jgi:hypothetical protein
MILAVQYFYIVTENQVYLVIRLTFTNSFRYDCEEHNAVFDGDNYAADDTSYKKKEAQLPKKLVYFLSFYIYNTSKLLHSNIHQLLFIGIGVAHIIVTTEN